MDKEECQELQALRSYKEKTGLSYEKIAKEIGVNSMSIYNWFRRYAEPSDMAKRLIRTFLENEEQSTGKNGAPTNDRPRG